jgi:RNA polymerase sigma-70 factor (ECF subfamily)
VHSVYVIGEPIDEESLPALVDGARQGHRRSLERLLGRLERTIHRWASRFTDDADDADDVTQDVLLTLERRVQQFAGDSRFSTWLYQVTRNAAIARLRRDSRRSALRVAHAPLEVQSVDDPDQEMDERAMAVLVRKYFLELPARQREVFELADLRGLSPAEIAEQLGL